MMDKTLIFENLQLNLDLFSRHHIPGMILTSQFKILEINTAAEIFLKRPSSKLKDKSVFVALSDETAGSEMLDSWRDKLAENDLWVSHLSVLIDDKPLPCRFIFHKFTERDKNIDQLLVSISGDTESRVTGPRRNRLEEHNNLLLSLSLALSNQGSLVIDQQSKKISFDDRWMAQLGYENFSPVQSIDFILSLVSPPDREKLKNALESSSEFDLNYKMATHEGVEVNVHAKGHAAGDGLILGIQKIIPGKLSAHPEDQIEQGNAIKPLEQPGAGGTYVRHQVESMVSNFGFDRFDINHVLDNLKLDVSEQTFLEMMEILVQNAIEASPLDTLIGIESGKCFYQQEYCVVCHQEFTGVRKYVSVTDKGDGIRDIFIPHVFSKAFTTKKINLNKSTGLHRLQQLVHANRGHILMKRTAGRTCFNLCFSESMTDWRHLSNPVQKKNKENDQFHLLVVDDHPAVAGFLTKALDDEAVLVTSTFHPQTALDLLKQDPGHFNLMITDQNLPGLNGYQVLEEARKLAPNLPIVMCSGENQGSIESWQKKGFFDYLTKPINVSKLIKMIDSLRR